MEMMEQQTIKKVALYARVSTEEQTKNFSIPSQKELIRNSIKQNDWELYDEYIDNGFSGTTMNRPQVSRLLEDAKAKKFDLILVYRIDRFARSTKDLLNVTASLQDLGIGIKSVTEPFDTATSTGKLMLSVFGSFAEFERNSIVERSKLGKIRRLKEGYYAGSARPKFGYDYDRKTKKLKINSKEADIVRLIYGKYNEPDGSILKVARFLRAMGHKTKFGNEWETDRVNPILRDHTYTGIWYGNMTTRTRSVKKPEDEWVPVKVPRIINEDLFKRTQVLLDERKIMAKRNAKHQYLLSGLLWCKDCGSKLSGVTDNNSSVKNGKTYGPYTKQYYRCVSYALNRLKETKTCHMRWIRADRLEEVVWGKIEEVICDPHLVEKMVQKHCKETKRLNPQDELNRLQSELRKIDKQEKRILEVFQEGIISKTLLKSQLDDIHQKRKILGDESSEIQSQMRSRGKIKGRLEEFSKFLAELRDAVKKLDFEKKKQLLRLLKTKITVGVDGGVDIECTVPVELPEKPHSPAIAWETPVPFPYG